MKMVRNKWVLLFLSYFALLATIITLAYLRLIPVEIAYIPFYDTLGHFVLLGITSYLAHRALNRKRLKFFGYSLPLGPILVSIFAVIEESLQGLSPYRTLSVFDLGANLSGILFFYWLDKILPPLAEVDFIYVTRRFVKLLLKLVVSASFPIVVFLTLGLTKNFEFELLYRYDILFLFLFFTQLLFIIAGFESRRDLYVILSFHVLGLLLELYKVNFGAWSYPEPAWTKILGVPLYSGFMYGSVAGFLIQLWRRLNFTISTWPPTIIVAITGLVIYSNFFSMDVSKEFRTFLVFAVVFIFFRSKLEFVNTTKRRSIPLIVTFTGLGVFIWIAENIATYLGAWAYPHQLSGWQMVHLSKINSWFLLGIVSFILVAQVLKGRNSV